MIDQLISAFTQLPQVDAIALGGSRSGIHFDETSDYDIYLYCNAPVPENIRYSILKEFCSYMEIGNHFWEYEDNCTLNNGIDIDILYRDLEHFTAEIADVVERCHGRNGYTTCMWHNLKTCKILYDKSGKLASTKNDSMFPIPEN